MPGNGIGGSSKEEENRKVYNIDLGNSTTVGICNESWIFFKPFKIEITGKLGNCSLSFNHLKNQGAVI